MKNPVDIVVFRKFKDDNEVIALFPLIDWDEKYCTSYMHVGQHSGADYFGLITDTEPASADEYAELKKELESIGYILFPVLADDAKN